MPPSHRVPYGLFSFVLVSLLFVFTGCAVRSTERPASEKDAPGFIGTAPAFAKRLESYAIVSAKPYPVRVTFFGIPDAPSLADTLETTILSQLGTRVGTSDARRWDPILTVPAERLAPEKFLEPVGTTPESTDVPQAGGLPQPTHTAPPNSPFDDSTGTTSITSTIVAAGEKFVLSRVDARYEDGSYQRAFLTNLDDDTTVPAADLFAAGKDLDARTVGSLAVNARGLPRLPEGSNGNGSELSELGREFQEDLVGPAPGAEATATATKEDAGASPQAGGDARPTDVIPPPDYSCALLPCASLTYDDGPTEDSTELADTLRAENVRASFFELGNRANAYPTSIKVLSDAGQEMGNHSWDHPKLTSLSGAQVGSQFRRTNKAIEKAGVEPSYLMRPPYGLFNGTTKTAQDMPLIMWDIDTLDWQNKSVAKTTDIAVTQSQPGSIVLMHAIHPSTVKAAPGVIGGLRERGFYLVNVSDMYEGIKLRPGETYFCRGERTDCTPNPDTPDAP